jgi:hypothetical protein
MMGHTARIVLALVICWLGIAPIARAEVILIDFSASLGSGGPGGTWNVYAQPTNINGSPVVDSTNTATAITTSITGQWTNSGNSGTTNAFDNNAAGLAGLPAWATSTTQNNASGDLFYTSNGSDGNIHQGILTFSNLPVGYTFTLDVLASRNTGAADGFYDFSLNGGGSYTGFTVLNGDGTVLTGRANTQAVAFDNLVDGYQNHRYMSSSGILTGSTLAFRMTDISNANGNFASVNAMRLTVTAIPEPGSVCLLLLGTAGYLLVRRSAKQA